MFDFLNGCLIYVYCDEEKMLDVIYSLVFLIIDGVIISVVKKVEDVDVFIICFFNLYL